MFWFSCLFFLFPFFFVDDSWFLLCFQFFESLVSQHFLPWGISTWRRISPHRPVSLVFLLFQVVEKLSFLQRTLSGVNSFFVPSSFYSPFAPFTLMNTCHLLYLRLAQKYAFSAYFILCVDYILVGLRLKCEHTLYMICAHPVFPGMENTLFDVDIGLLSSILCLLGVSMLFVGRRVGHKPLLLLGHINVCERTKKKIKAGWI